MKKKLKKPTPKSKAKPIRKATPKRTGLTNEQKLAELRRTFSDENIILVIRDRRAVIHWPLTLDRLEDLKARLTQMYGVVIGSDEYITAMEQALTAASQWPLCACGSLCRVIPRMVGATGPFGAPLDSVLRVHGQDFYENIKNGDLVKARMSMNNVEYRATEVVRNLGKKKVDYPTL